MWSSVYGEAVRKRHSRQTAWFYLMLYFGRRGRENQRNMVKEDIVFGKTANGLEYVALRAWERATKYHPGGLRDNEDNSQDVMCEWPDNPERCPVRCIKKYLEKRNPNCPVLWQKPRNYSTGKFNESDACGTAISLWGKTPWTIYSAAWVTNLVCPLTSHRTVFGRLQWPSSKQPASRIRE